MAVIPRVDYKNATGLIDKVVGLGKEIFGEVVGNDNVREAGEAQQAKATEKLKAVREQAKADKHETAAKTHQQREKAAQRAK